MIRALGIGLIGADSTGKTTVARELRRIYAGNLRFISEVSRNVIKKGFPLGKDASPESYVVLMQDQIFEVLSMVKNNTPFVSDRTLLDQYCYSRVNRTLPRPAVLDIYIRLNEMVWELEREYYRLYLYLPIEFPFVPDGVRVADEKYQHEIDEEFRRLINVHNIPYVKLTGSVEDRVEQARQAIDHVFFDQ